MFRIEELISDYAAELDSIVEYCAKNYQYSNGSNYELMVSGLDEEFNPLFDEEYAAIDKIAPSVAELHKRRKYRFMNNGDYFFYEKVASWKDNGLPKKEVSIGKVINADKYGYECKDVFDDNIFYSNRFYKLTQTEVKSLSQSYF